MFDSSRRASAATIRAKSERILTANSGMSASCRSRSTAMLDSLDFIGFTLIGKHDNCAQYQQSYDRDFGRVRPERKAQSCRDAGAGYRALADAAVWPKPSHALLDAVVHLMQRFA